ncbi:MAG: hypothetical protein IPH09_08315 [bacterium]|nr:hypothetical protein [bacterium]MBK9302653.1 hypothetical protein [bacterium]
MPPSWKGLLVGGLLPALLFGVTGILQKAAGRAGAGVGPYLLCTGAGVALVGAAFAVARLDNAVSWRAGLLAGGVGASWGLGMALVLIALTRFATPLSKLAPLYNLNTLVVVLLALVVYAEWRDVHLAKLIAGAALVVLGGILVANA